MTDTSLCDLCGRHEGVETRQLLGKFDGEEYVGAFRLCEGCEQEVTEGETEEQYSEVVERLEGKLPDWIATEGEAIAFLYGQLEEEQQFRTEQQQNPMLDQFRGGEGGMTGAMPIDTSREGVFTSGKSLSVAVAVASLSLTALSFVIGLFAMTSSLNISPALPYLISAIGAAITIGATLYWYLAPTNEEAIEASISESVQEIFNR